MPLLLFYPGRGEMEATETDVQKKWNFLTGYDFSFINTIKTHEEVTVPYFCNFIMI